MFRFPGIKWASKEVSIYVEHTEFTWSSARKIMVAADPSSYCGQETMVGVLWSWELDKVESWQAMCGGSATPGDLHRVCHTQVFKHRSSIATTHPGQPTHPAPPHPTLHSPHPTHPPSLPHQGQGYIWKAIDIPTTRLASPLAGMICPWLCQLYDKAVYAPTQIIPGAQCVLPGEIAMSDFLMTLLRARRLERIKAYREWCSLCFKNYSWPHSPDVAPQCHAERCLFFGPRK